VKESDGALLLTEIRGSIMIMTLNRPSTRNAINGVLAAEIAAALRHLDSDSTLLAGVLTGNGHSFCSGMDLRDFQDGGTPQDLQDVLRISLAKPLVAAVEGFAVAGGFELALRCDLIVAARGSKLGLPEVKVGQIAGFGIRQLLQELPRQAVAELALTGDFLSAERAYELGLVTRLVDPGQSLHTALELAAAIIKNAPLSLAASLSLLNIGSTESEVVYYGVADQRAQTTSHSHDALEGAAAFTERRGAKWEGR
jgi:enoyl-CoA hydratase